MSKSRAEQGEATRALLVKTARRLFAQHGYAETSLEDIRTKTKLTRGALYHHFPDGKSDLFREVFEQVESQLAESLALAALAAPDAWGQLVAGCDAFLDACLD